MFHPTVIAASIDRYYRDPDIAPLLPQLDLPVEEDYPVEWCHSVKQELDGLLSDDGTARPPSLEQQQFILHEQLRAKVDYAYAAQRYHVISAEGVGLKPLFPLWESQQVTLETLARVELQRHQDNWGAVLLACLKARQLGLSTFTQSIMAHKATTQGHLRMMVASDVEDSSTHLYNMFEVILDELPWWLKPGVRNKAVGVRRVFDTGTVYWAAWGKSSRGGLKEKGGQKGNLGRGKTVSQFHISEYSTWEYPEQLRDGFFPAVPLKISTFGVVESTAKGKGDEWHKLCQGAMNHRNDFVLNFIPWYAEITKYSRPAPVSWTPKATTLAHAKRCEQEGPKYLFKPVSLTRDQLYWWEKRRDDFEDAGALYQFLEEYPAEPDEAFQYSGRSCFPIHVIERIRHAAKPPLVVCELRPHTAAAQYLAAERDRQTALALGLPAESSSADPADPAVQPVAGPAPRRGPGSLPAPLAVPVVLPDGYGFRALGQEDLRQRLAALGQRGLLDLLQIWEPPRRRGPRKYIMAVDVSDGVGLDRSVVDLIRCPTLFEPAEQVAQFITDSRSPDALAYCCDALGRWYLDDDKVEAQATVECNIGPGMVTQNTLQLHLQYPYFYIWEYLDAADPSRRLTRKAGWWTNTRTRPMLLGKLYSALTMLDPLSGKPDFVVNSEWTITDLANFVSPTGRLEDGEAGRGFFDDCVMTAGIGIFAAWQKMGGEQRPIEELRRARAAERALEKDRNDQRARDWRNSPVPADYAQKYLRPEDDPGDPDVTTRFEGDPLGPDPSADPSLFFGYTEQPR